MCGTGFDLRSGRPQRYRWAAPRFCSELLIPSIKVGAHPFAGFAKRLEIENASSKIAQSPGGAKFLVGQAFRPDSRSDEWRNRGPRGAPRSLGVVVGTIWG